MQSECQKMIQNGEACECHPVESAVMIEAMESIVQAAAVRAIQALARQILDDELVLSEEILEVK